MSNPPPSYDALLAEQKEKKMDGGLPEPVFVLYDPNIHAAHIPEDEVGPLPAKTDPSTIGSGSSIRRFKDQETGSTTDSSGKSDENKERGNWGGKLDFLLSCIGYAVGLGNIWRFPYLCYKNGGGAFLIPYLTFLCLCGMPLMLLEMSFGQFASLSPIAIWKISPLFKGLGYGMVIISGVVCIYYNIIIAWTIFYLINSFTDVLPWSHCNNDWNTDACALRWKTNDTNTTSPTASTLSVMDKAANLSSYAVASAATAINHTRSVTPSEEFWKWEVLEITPGIEDIGVIRWQLLVALIVAWLLVFLCLCKGVKSSGKVVYVTAVFPYIVLIILCIRGVTLPGARDGIEFYLVPDWKKLASFKVWGEAAMQIFYSVGASWGALITMSSYNKFRNNCYRDAMIVPLINCGTSIFAGLVIFSIIGFMAHETGSPIRDVVDKGPGLIFVVYPEALTRLPISPLWAILFFLMIFTVGLDSQFGMFETMISAFVDEFPRYLKNKKLLITGLLCLVEFVAGVACVTQGGIYVLQIMDWYSSTFSLMIISFFECIVIGWIYGADRFYEDIELMIGFKPNRWWMLCWKFITPITILFVFGFSVGTHSPVTYGSDEETYHYPQWAVAIGWCLALFSILPLPILAVVALCRAPPGSFLQKIRSQVRPTAEWGPAVEQYREQWIASLSPSMRERFLPISKIARSEVCISRTTTATALYESKMTIDQQ